MPVPAAPPIGFAILSHRAPHQLHRLVHRLTALYRRPPIAIHHDATRTPIPSHLAFPNNACFVTPPRRTYWGDISFVRASLRALELLYPAASPGPDFVTLLSAADYPIAPPERVLADLRGSGADAFLDLIPITPLGPATPWQRVCRDRYLRWRWAAGPFTTRLARAVRITLPMGLSRPLLPYSSELVCHAGSTWYTLSRRGAAALLARDATHRAVARAMRHAGCCDEAYPHTILAHAARQGRIRHDPRAFRFVDWASGDDKHPRTLGLADVPRLLASGAHFARKFDDADAATLDAIDRAVDTADQAGTAVH